MMAGGLWSVNIAVVAIGMAVNRIRHDHMTHPFGGGTPTLSIFWIGSFLLGPWFAPQGNPLIYGILRASCDLESRLPSLAKYSFTRHCWPVRALALCVWIITPGHQLPTLISNQNDQKWFFLFDVPTWYHMIFPHTPGLSSEMCSEIL